MAAKVRLPLFFPARATSESCAASRNGVLNARCTTSAAYDYCPSDARTADGSTRGREIRPITRRKLVVFRFNSSPNLTLPCCTPCAHYNLSSVRNHLISVSRITDITTPRWTSAFGNLTRRTILIRRWTYQLVREKKSLWTCDTCTVRGSPLKYRLPIFFSVQRPVTVRGYGRSCSWLSTMTRVNDFYSSADVFAEDCDADTDSAAALCRVDHVFCV